MLKKIKVLCHINITTRASGISTSKILDMQQPQKSARASWQLFPLMPLCNQSVTFCLLTYTYTPDLVYMTKPYSTNPQLKVQQVPL